MEKKKYISPVIELIVLDNEISLALASSPPAGPSEAASQQMNDLQNPFKDNGCLV